MKFYDFGIILFVVVICVCVVGGIGSVYLLGPDNAIEETAEAIIDKETGLDVDLSPQSLEKKKKMKKKKTWQENQLAKKALACGCSEDQ